MLFKFLSEFFRGIRSTYTIIVMDERQIQDPRQYRVKSSRFLQFWALTMLLAGALMVSVVAFTPLRELIPSNGTAEMQRQIVLNSLRVAALRDSLDAQLNYASQLRMLIMGHVDSTFFGTPEEPVVASMLSQRSAPSLSPEPAMSFRTEHEQPALTIPSMPVNFIPGPKLATTGGTPYLSSVPFPALPPVDGFLTRGFDARTGHYAIDVAAEEGSIIRAVGDGYVIFADWTHEGGYTIAVQHADGYVSVYKHAKRLLKRVGDRVRNRDAIALSGNSGEITSGPHLHFELWLNGLAQDPRYFFVGW
jgi:murein DD-endopeptidase MepM/ murein hydrolase activator NlpD